MALHRRNVLGLKVPFIAAKTEDVAKLIASRSGAHAAFITTRRFDAPTTPSPPSV